MVLQTMFRKNQVHHGKLYHPHSTQQKAEIIIQFMDFQQEAIVLY